ncbi:protein kinase domain-containing protein [Dyella sp. 20L07]|uniref:protein kinase domain-containing protein n=1 Tax=Dyella sp. 20L07 TaxID=3384240 RepID=UPI003D2BB3A3
MTAAETGSGDEWSLLEPLLDQLLDLSPQQREIQLAAWHDTRPAVVARLRQLLRAEQEAAAAGFLDTLPGIVLDEAATAFAVGDLVGPWRLLAPLGRGGMAEVWLARRDDGQLDREVALKLPLNGYANGLNAGRFRRERDILAGLAHPHIARLYDAGVDARGQSWLALEHVRGDEVLAWCASQALDVGARIRLFLQICEAVQYAHGRLVIHRDIKPANVLVDAEGSVHLLDFGIAKLLDVDDDGDTGLTALAGRPLTLEYASPEQVEGDVPGIASDIYALGVLLYRLLCGVSPYEVAGTGRRALEQSIISQSPRPPSERGADAVLRRRLRGDIDTIVLKALSKAPSARYATVDAFAADLRRYLQGETVLARRPSVGYRLSRFVGRHRLGVAVTVFVAASLLGTTGVALHQAAVARREVAHTQALYQFVLSLFNPDNKPIPDTRYRDMPARELVAHGAERVITSLPDQPQARFQLMHDLAALTASLGMADVAGKLHEARVEQSGTQMGQNSPEYADALLDRTSDLEGQGHYPDAYRDAQRALAIYEAAGEHDVDRLARAHYQVAAFGMHSHAAGDTSDLQHLQQAAALWRGRYGKSEFGSVMERLTQYYLLTNRNDDAYRAAREGMENNRRQFGEVDWKTAAAEEQTGLMLGNLLRPAEAEPLLRQALSTQQTIWGREHFLVARSRMYLGNLLVASIHQDEARELLRQARASIHAPAWQGNKVVLSAFIDQSNIDFDDKHNDYADALATCEPYYQELPALQAPIHLKLALACSHAAVVAGRWDDANHMLDDATRTVAANWPSDPARMAPVWRRRGELDITRGDKASAMHAFAQALTLADGDDLDTLSGAWLGLAQANTSPLDQAQRQAIMQMLVKLESPARRDYYALYARRLHEALGGARS